MILETTDGKFETHKKETIVLNKEKTVMTSIGSLMLAFALSGCGTPEPKYDANNRLIVFSDGKPYRVPYGVSYSPINKLTIDAYKKMKILTNCKVGDLIWVSIEYPKKFPSPQSPYSYIVGGFSTGQMGCAKVMSDKEYQYYSSLQQQNKQIQHERQIQAQKNQSAASDRRSNSYANKYSAPSYSAPSYNSQPTVYRIKEYHPMNSGMGF